jgi:serine/threonine-protein kinase
VRSDVPPALEAVIRRCQEKDPASRFQHIGELAAALAPLVGGRSRISADRVLDIARSSGLSSRVSVDVTSRSLSTPPPLATVASAPMNLGMAATVASNAVPGGTGSTSAMWTGTLEPRKKSSSAVAVVAAIVSVALLVGGVVVVFVARSPAQGQPSSGAEAAGPSAAAVGAPTSNAAISPPPLVIPSVTPDTTGNVAQPAAQPAALPVEQPSASPQKPAVAKPSPTAKPTATAAAKAPPKNPGGGLFNDRN